ncbi:hypothetical protein A3715_14030 [Oleiphilus sp. HI0009]|nr:hypothetical protein A3715_14030 [Oleiphilus sp. HI0009]
MLTTNDPKINEDRTLNFKSKEEFRSLIRSGSALSLREKESLIKASRKDIYIDVKYPKNVDEATKGSVVPTLIAIPLIIYVIADAMFTYADKEPINYLAIGLTAVLMGLLQITFIRRRNLEDRSAYNATFKTASEEYIKKEDEYFATDKEINKKLWQLNYFGAWHLFKKQGGFKKNIQTLDYLTTTIITALIAGGFLSVIFVLISRYAN